MNSRLLVKPALVLLLTTCLCGSRLVHSAPPASPSEPKASLYAFCFDTHDAQKRTLAEQAAMLRELGYDGAGHVGLQNLAERLKTLDDAQLRLFLAGLRIDLTKDKGIPVKQLKQALPLLKDRDVLLYADLAGLPPGSPQGNDRAVPLLREMADLARPFHVRIGIYPHTGDWVDRVDRAIAVAQQVDRPNCGVIFNLCHFLRNEDVSDLNQRLSDARPFLFGITMNGADVAGKADKDWGRLIQPLDRGTFDLKGFLEQLNALKYRGPIGLMCYGIGGDARQHLSRSLRKWHELQRDETAGKAK